MHFPRQRNGISKLYRRFKWNQNGPEKSISNLELISITKYNRGLKVYKIRELLSTIY
jgi:hypothetical protein